MTSNVASNRVQESVSISSSYERLAGIAAMLAAAAGLLYSIAFVVLKDQLLYSLFLMLGGLLAAVVLVALYERVYGLSSSFALLALLLGIVGTLGSAIHGGYDLSNAVNSPTSDPISAANLPNQLDPRGLLTFGVAGLSVLLFSWLISKMPYFPKNVSYLGYLLGVLMVLIYLVRLIILDPNASPIIPAVLALTGVIVSPAWYVWLGLIFLRGESSQK